MRDHFLFFVNGVRHQVAGEDALLTLAEYLRNRLGLVGTKIVCNEGDCGACSVLAARVHSTAERPQYQPIDSCIAFLYQLDRTHIVTVEGLQNGTELTPIQQALVSGHGSQCGFCTPGIAIAMQGIVEAGKPLQEPQLRYGLSGNLCRCTGYQQIFDSGSSVAPGDVKQIDEIYCSNAIREELSKVGDEPVELVDATTVFLPHTLDQACDWLGRHPGATVASGATDLGVLHNHGQRANNDVLCLCNMDDFAEITIADDVLAIGGGASWLQIEQAVKDYFPPYYEIITRFGSPQVRALGTLAGNLATGSPIADSIPFHLAMDSEIMLVSAGGQRTVRINDFYTGYRENIMNAGELIAKVTTPLLRGDERLAVYKISKRRDMDISTLTFALRIRLTDATISHARLAIGGVGPTVQRIVEAEHHLVGNHVTLETFQRAGEIARDCITPWTDVRGSEEFRLMLAENLLSKAYYEFNSQRPVAV